MADTPKKKESEPAVFDSDIGDDWGEAFEAEDYLAPPAEQPEEFFLDETTPEPGAPPPAPPGKANKAGKAASGEAAPARKGPPPLLAAATRLRQQFQNAAPKQKALFLGVPAILVAALLILALLPPRKSAPPAALRPLIATLPVEPSAPAEPMPSPAATAELPPPEPPPEGTVAPEEHPAPAPPLPKESGGKEKVRKKWPLPNFFIPLLAPGAGEPPLFLSANLTLTLFLEEGGELPLEKELLLRDAIYQFYRNQPLPELRRYSLARHEMNLKLQAWLKRAWPEAPLATVVFDHYAVQ